MKFYLFTEHKNLLPRQQSGEDEFVTKSEAEPSSKFYQLS